MRKYLILITLLTGLVTFANAPQWGKTGHRTTAEIADQYLTDKTKAAITDLLDGYSTAFVSTYADEIKSDRNFDEYSAWHYINIPEGKTYVEVKDDLGPNIISAIKKAKKGLKDPTTPREKKQFYLKMLIHLIGDLHQPLHIGR
ncbi:MAG TPA: S1/P1 nuclease, partial [Flavobacteriaceae bacterium]|nr:S1/P1 nuclease [Flavobacteriaceae bacterium]